MQTVRAAPNEGERLLLACFVDMLIRVDIRKRDGTAARTWCQVAAIDTFPSREASKDITVAPPTRRHTISHCTHCDSILEFDDPSIADFWKRRLAGPSGFPPPERRCLRFGTHPPAPHHSNFVSPRCQESNRLSRLREPPPKRNRQTIVLRGEIQRRGAA